MPPPPVHPLHADFVVFGSVVLLLFELQPFRRDRTIAGLWDGKLVRHWSDLTSVRWITAAQIPQGPMDNSDPWAANFPEGGQ